MDIELYPICYRVLNLDPKPDSIIKQYHKKDPGQFTTLYDTTPCLFLSIQVSFMLHLTFLLVGRKDWAKSTHNVKRIKMNKQDMIQENYNRIRERVLSKLKKTNANLRGDCIFAWIGLGPWPNLVQGQLGQPPNPRGQYNAKIGCVQEVEPLSLSTCQLWKVGICLKIHFRKVSIFILFFWSVT